NVPNMTHTPKSKDWSRQKGIRVITVSCLVFAIAITVALIVDVYVGDHHTGHAAIATDVQECSDIGLKLMKKGGSAVDAAVGALFCVGVMNPESSGIGGGGFMVVSTHKHGDKVIDFREVAPQAATSDMFNKSALLAKEGGLAIAVPGELKGLEFAHKKYGKLKWSEIIEPSIKLARDGFTISDHTAKVLSWKDVQDSLKNSKNSKQLMEMLAPKGIFLKAGDKIKNPRLAETLTKIAHHGSKALYEGPIAQSIVDAVRKGNGNISLSDLKNYRVEVKDCLYSEYQVFYGTGIPCLMVVAKYIHFSYFIGYQILTAPLPASGPDVISALNILERFNFTKTDQAKNVTYQYLIEAFKFAFAQRTHLGDPSDPANSGIANFTKKIMSKELAAEIQHKIFSNKTFPPSYYSPASEVIPNHGTSHVSVLSPDGEMVSVTSTINEYFGSYVMTDTGIILNNEMKDFSVEPPYYKVTTTANSVQPGKRPLSSCSPLIIRHKQDACRYMAIGASGGTHIPTAVIQTLINILSFGDTLQDAVERPRVHHQLIPNVAEAEGDIFKKWKQSSVIDFLRHVGHVVKTTGIGYADVNVAQNYRSNLRAHSDSRRGGSGSGTY
ncbi:hypothetical protein QZH41_009263, partial [Actinostola sp. cb2023]